MSGSPARPRTTQPTSSTTFAAIGTSATIVVAEPGALPPAEGIARDLLAELDQTCSRFREDSEVRTLPRGRWCTASAMLTEALGAALRAAELTDGLVDPTVADAMCTNGYDRDFADLRDDGAQPPVAGRPVPGWWRIGLVAARRQVLVPHDVHLDLGATAKAFAADLIAECVHRETGSPVLVSLGGDIAMAGPPPAGGWRIGVGADHARPAPADPVVTVAAGGLATSSTLRRRWRRGETVVHHIIDPRTGRNPAPCWDVVSVAAGSCVDANTAATAAVVLGPVAPRWLAQRGLPARLMASTGEITTVASWPDGDEA